MASFVVWGLLAGIVVSTTTTPPQIPSALTSSSVASNGFVQGSGVVNAGVAQNFMDFSFSSGVITSGDRIAFYIWDKDKSTASTSYANEYNCGATKSELKSPLLSISPSYLFNATGSADMTVPSSAGASRTSFFGGLAAGRYKLCYCKKPAISTQHPSGICRPSDYKWSAGVYFFYDVPQLRQRKAVNTAKTHNRFLFQIKKFKTDGSAQRIVIPDHRGSVPSHQQSFEKTTGCSAGSNWFGSGQPAWSNGGVDQTTQLTPLQLVRSFHSYDEVAFHTPLSQQSALTPAGFYSVCLCDSENIGTGSATPNCITTSSCTTKSCFDRIFAPVEIATVFVHDLTFSVKSQKVFALSSNKTASFKFTFLYSEPAAFFTGVKSFWFARSSVNCGDGTHSPSPHRTSATKWGASGSLFSTDTSKIISGSLLDPLRLCVKTAVSVVDIDNIVIVISDFSVTAGDLSDKISDNNQAGIRPSLDKVITGGKYQKTANKPEEDHGLWFSENFVNMHLKWNSSVAKYDEIFAVKSTYPCNVWTSLGQFRSDSYVASYSSFKSANVTFDLGKTLFNSTSFDLSNNFDPKNLIAPAAGSVTEEFSNSPLFSDYSLCITCQGCSYFGYDTGVRFRVLASLHVYQDVGFGKPYVMNSGSQKIVIASNVVPAKSSPTLFQKDDQLYFMDTTKTCSEYSFDYNSAQSSKIVFGSTTKYTSPTSGGSAQSLLNAFEFKFDFSISSLRNGKESSKLLRLCVARPRKDQSGSFSEQDVLDFSGCQISVLSQTASPTLTSIYVSSKTYSATPLDAGKNDNVLKSVVTDGSYNRISWKFVGVVQAADKLSISSYHGKPEDPTTKCLPTTYSYMSFQASSGGLTSTSPAQSATINGLMPGLYVLCYCNTLVDSVVTQCRTARDFSMFAGYVYFNSAYANLIDTFAVTANVADKLEFKMTQASKLDRISIVRPAEKCNTAYSQDYSLLDKKFKGFRITSSPTRATNGPTNPTAGPTKRPTTKFPTTKFPTRSPTTRAPTSKAPTAAPTRSPITKAPVGRRLLSTKAPTTSPTTRAPTRSPTTSPTTRAPTTTFPTKFPTKTPTSNPSGRPNNSKSPTINGDGVGPYQIQELASHTFTTVGRFKVCYCWHDRFRGIAETNTNVNRNIKFPTQSPTTKAPTPPPTNGRRLLGTVQFAMVDFNNVSSSSCADRTFGYQRFFGVHVADLVVHDIYFVSYASSDNVNTQTTRLAVRATTSETIKFISRDTFLSASNTVWFQKYKSKCNAPGVSGESTPSFNNLVVSSTVISTTFDFSNGFSRACNGVRRVNSFDTIEEQFFYRMCIQFQQPSVVTWDFKNLMVTVTDIVLMADYRNPVIKSGSLAATIKFNEACGFLWSERDWKKQSTFAFVAAQEVCSVSSQTTKITNSVQYRMYEGSLIKYFLDDADYQSQVVFAAVPVYRTPFRLCLRPQESTVWIDYPSVEFFPVSESPKLSSVNANYATPASCPVGWLGCKCSASNTCFSKFYRQPTDSLNGYTWVKGECDTKLSGGNLCVAPSRLLWGSLDYNSNPACDPSSICSNPGPISGADQRLYLSFTSTDLVSYDSVRFVPSSDDCTTALGATTYVTNIVSKNLITVATNQLGSGSVYHRMCVKTGTNRILDYYRTGFTLSGQKTGSPTRKTYRPTTARNKGNTLTYSPTMALPQFHDRTSLLTTYRDNPALAQNVNALYITQPLDSSNVLYTQWTNWTWGQVKAGDTLRVYRDIPTAVNDLSPDSICSADWFARTMRYSNNDLVMEVKVNQNGGDVNSPSASASVQFPALAKGYYTACFCRATPSQRCQMSAAGMIYSSAARMVSVTGVGTKDASFFVTPLLDYEVTPDLFNTSKFQYITADHFCLSNSSSKVNACGSCRVQALTGQSTRKQEFDISLTGGSFPLKITNKLLHGLSSTDRVFNLCFKDPMLMQFVETNKNTTHMMSTRPDVNAIWWMNGWQYGLIGTVFLSDLNFQWEQNGGFSLKRSSYSIRSDGSAATMVKISYTASTDVIDLNDEFWFTASQYDCNYNPTTSSTTSRLRVPANSRVFQLFLPVQTGRFYRMCVKPKSSLAVRDFGTDFGVWVTDIVASSANFKFFKSFHLALASTTTLHRGDEFFLLHIAQLRCSDYSSLQVGWVSPNIGSFNYSVYHNMGKMPQITNVGSTNTANIPLGYVGYRLCVKRTIAEEISYLDFAGTVFTPEGSMHIVNTVVPKKTKADIRILSGLERNGILYPSFTIQPLDVVWFNRADTSCAKSIWSSSLSRETSVSGTNGHKFGSSTHTVLVADFHTSGHYLTLGIDFRNTDTSTQPFRLCLERKSWLKGVDGTTAITQSIVQSYPDITVTVSDSIVDTTSFPTSFDSFRSKTTSKPTTTPVSPYIVRTVYSNHRQNTFEWGFEGGSVDPAKDKLAVVADSSSGRCDGSISFANPVLLIPAVAVSQAGSDGLVSNSPAVVDSFGSLAAGKYFLCYCQASSSITGDCSNELGWRQTVGYLYSLAVSPRSYSVSTLTPVASSFTVWFDQQVSNSMRIMAIDAGGTCGNVAASSTLNARLDQSQTVPQIEAVGYTLNTGLTVTRSYNTAVQGFYKLCLCTVACPWNANDNSGYLNYGGSVGTLVVHDVKLNGENVVTLHKTSSGSQVVNLTMTWSKLFTAGTDKIWFSRHDCGKGNHTTAHTNRTEIYMMPVSGATLSINYTLMSASMDTIAMCVMAKSSVYELSSVGFIVTDVVLTDVSPERKTNSPVGISYFTGLQALTPNPSNRVVFFRAISQPCDSACGTEATCSIQKNQYTSNSAQLPVSWHTNKQPTNFDFSLVTPLSAFRLCVLLDSKSANPKAFVDLNNIRVFPVAPNTDFRVLSGAALYLDNYNIKFKFPNIGSPRPTDFLYFRHSDEKCLDTLTYPEQGKQPLSIADKNTTNTFRYVSSNVPVAVNFSHINLTSTPLRLCVLTPQATLDYHAKKLFMTDLVLSTKLCRPTTSDCEVHIQIKQPEGFFTSSTGFSQSSGTFIWFQRPSSAQPDCLLTPPTTSTSSHSARTLFTPNVNNRMSFTNTAGSIIAPLKLCARNNQNIIADFPSVQLYVLNVRLTPVTSASSIVFTKFVTANKNSAVRISADVASLPLGTMTWFQRSDQTCSKPTGSSINSTSINQTTSELKGQDTLYDFSGVQSSPKQMVSFRLCYEPPNQGSAIIIDADNVVVTVVQYIVDPVFFSGMKGQQESFQIWPGVQVQIKQYVFCREDVPCPNLNQFATLGTSNMNCSQRAFHNDQRVNVEFWNVKSEGKLMRLCGLRDNIPSPDNVVDLAPVGVYRGKLSLEPHIVDQTQTSSTVKITWESILEPPVVTNTSQLAKVWFQARETACSKTLQKNSSVASNVVDVKKGTFSGSFQFSKVSSSVLKLCADVDGTIKDFAAVKIFLMNFSLSATSVKATKEQNFTMTYNDIPEFGKVSVSISSDTTCKSNQVSAATPFVDSVSGVIHSFDFSKGIPSSQKWILCLRANATDAAYPVGFVSVFLEDIGDLGKVYVDNAKNQMLKLSSSVSLLVNDTVWFSSAGCQNNVSRSSSVIFTGPSTYSFDFTTVSPSLLHVSNICVSKATRIFEFSSVFVTVVQHISFGGPFIAGQRSLDLSKMSDFLGSSQVSFVTNTSSCIGAKYVDAATSTYNFANSGTYRMCVKEPDGKIHSLSSLSVEIQKCGGICSNIRSTGECTQAATCKQCKPRFSGDLCQSCSDGYTGNNCDICDMSQNYHCSNNSSPSGFCGSSSACSICTCNGHYDPKAKNRCPLNKCVCDVGYTGDACQDCSAGHYKMSSNSSTTFTCSNCADKCNKRASSCTANICQCTGNFDASSNCQFCKPGFKQLNATSDCFQTVSPTFNPTFAPTIQPTRNPTFVPTVGPTTGSQCTDIANVHATGHTNDTARAQAEISCTQWAKDDLCVSGSSVSWMNQNCAKACCLDAYTVVSLADISKGCAAKTDAMNYTAECPLWADQGLCLTNTWVGQNCPRSCCEFSAIEKEVSKCDSVFCDTDKSCTAWTNSGYCQTNEYEATMLKLCSQSCCRSDKCALKRPDLNTDNAATTTTTSCQDWASQGFCTSPTWQVYMAQQCARTCCTLNSFNKAYADTENQSCSAYVESGYCSQYSDWMKENCPRSCCNAAQCANTENLHDPANTGYSCQDFQGWGYCKDDRYLDYMTVNCRKTCCLAGGL